MICDLLLIYKSQIINRKSFYRDSNRQYFGQP